MPRGARLPRRGITVGGIALCACTGECGAEECRGPFGCGASPGLPHPTTGRKVKLGRTPFPGGVALCCDPCRFRATVDARKAKAAKTRAKKARRAAKASPQLALPLPDDRQRELPF